MNAHTNAVFSPTRLGPVELRNRIIKCATYETRSRDGLVTDELTEWHREFAAGGVAMTTLAYCSVSSDGRTFRDQIWMRDEALEGLQGFCREIHAAGAKAAIQLGHAGWFADPRATKTKPLGPSRMFSPHSQAFSRAMTEDDLTRVTADFARAARLAVDAGFDALEIHVGHGYLLSQFLSPYNNRRRDRWGGSLENRARFPRRVLTAVREAAGGSAAVYAKLNMDDGFKRGLTLDDALTVAEWIEGDGSLDAIQLTGGHTTKTPMFLMRGDSPLEELLAHDRSRLRRIAMRLVAPFMLRTLPFEEAFFLPMARRFRKRLDMPLMLLGGVNRLETMERAIAEGFELIAVGRGLIRTPDLVRRMQAGELEDSLCIHCNKCVARIGLEPTRCVERDAAGG